MVPNVPGPIAGPGTSVGGSDKREGQMSQRKINWGILSTANIGTEKVIPAIQSSPSSHVLAIASRSIGRARQAAQSLGIPKAYGSYEELLQDPDIDVIYNPLPNNLHVELTIAAAKAGKHVLCEKPVALNAAEAEKLRECPKGSVVSEGFMVRYHPQWLRARDLVRSGELGEVRAVQAAFSYFNSDPSDIRNRMENGGGAIMDIGCYPVVAGRFFFDAEPQRLVSLIDRDVEFATDRQTSVIADFGGGRQLSFVVSTQLVPYQTLNLLGTKGRAEMAIPFNAPQGQATALIVDGGESLDSSLARREIIAACDQYAEQAEAIAQAVLNKRPLPYGIDDAIKSMRVLDAIFESERMGGWVDI